ncbi:MAG: HAD family hydrolase [Anaerolineales bacterium]
MKALIFDFDGLILDTETPEFEAWQAIYHEFGQELDPQIWGQFVGGAGATDFSPVTHLEALLGAPVNGAALQARARAEALVRIHQMAPLPGVEETLTAARRLGLRLAIASSSPHAWVEGHLLRLGLLSYFEAFLCREDVAAGRTKPHPDLFLAALQALGIAPGEALIFEDSPNGVLAARRAGVRVVAVPNPLTARLAMSGETLRLASLAGQDLAALLARADGGLLASG